MYCYNCGTDIGTGKNYCPNCGADLAPEVLQKTKKFKNWIWITAASTALVILAICAVYFVFFHNVSHMMKVGRALNSISEEIEERIDNSPLKALSMLPEIMEDGTINASVDYSYDLFGDWFDGADIGVDIQLSSNTKEREFALNIKDTSLNIFEEVNLQMNRERIALNLDILDSNYYGIRYDTFRDDIRVFGRLIFLDNETMDTMSDIVDIINEIINFEETDDLQEAYAEAFIKFAGNLKTTSNRTTIESSGENVRCTAIEILVTKADIFSLLTDIYEIAKTNESLQAQYAIFDNPAFTGLFGGYGGSFYEEYLQELRDVIDDFEKSYEGDIRVGFYIGSDDRLLKMTVNTDMEYEGEKVDFDASFGFGNGVEDDWIFIINSDGISDNFEIIWSYNSQSGNHINTLDINIDSSSTVLVSEWDDNTGRFKLSYSSILLPGGEITGNFTFDDDSFQLKFDNLLSEQTNGRLLIDLSAKQGAQINEIDFINIDKWGSALIESLTKLLLGLIF